MKLLPDFLTNFGKLCALDYVCHAARHNPAAVAECAGNPKSPLTTACTSFSLPDVVSCETSSAAIPYLVNVTWAISQAQKRGTVTTVRGPYKFKKTKYTKFAYPSCNHNDAQLVRYPIFGLQKWGDEILPEDAPLREWRGGVEYSVQGKPMAKTACTPISVVYHNCGGAVVYCGIITYHQADDDGCGFDYMELCNRQNWDKNYQYYKK